MNWFLYDNGLRHKRVKFKIIQKQNFGPGPRPNDEFEIKIFHNLITV